MSEIPDLRMILSLSLEEQKDHELFEGIRRRVNPQAIDLFPARHYIRREGLEEALDRVPRIAADWSNYPAWKEAFDNVISTNVVFNLVTTKPTKANLSEDEQALTIAMKSLLSRKLDDYVEDKEFAKELIVQPIYEKLEMFNAQYENWEYKRHLDEYDRRFEMLTELAEDFYISNPSESNSDNLRNRVKYLEKLQEHPAMMAPGLLFAELNQLVTDSGNPPVSNKILKIQLTKAIEEFEKEDMTGISNIISNLIVTMKKLLKQRDIMILDDSVHPKTESQADASAEVRDRKKGYRKKPFIRLWKNVLNSDCGRDKLKSGLTKRVLYKHFYLGKLCPFCYGEDVNFATHDCLE